MALSEAARRRASALGVFGVAGGLFAWNLSRSWLYLTDDAFISLRYAARFAQGLGLTWNDGERVEGYSNLLWVLLLSVPSALGLDPVGAMVGLGLLSTAATFALLLRATGPLGRLGQGAAAFALALAAPLGVWTQAGLEGPLFTALGLGAVVSLLPLLGAGPGPLLSPALGRAGLFLGLACLTRPDAPVLVAGLAAGLFLAGGAGPPGARPGRPPRRHPRAVHPGAAWLSSRLLRRLAAQYGPRQARRGLRSAPGGRPALSVALVEGGRRPLGDRPAWSPLSTRGGSPPDPPPPARNPAVERLGGPGWR